MNKKLCRSLTLLSVALAVAALAMSGVSVAQAQGIPADSFKISYYANSHQPNAPDAFIRIDNPGSNMYKSVCALIYVFTADQQLTECCACPNSHNNLRTLSMNVDLTNNPLTGVPSSTGAIKIVSASPNAAGKCDPTGGSAPVATLRAWATHTNGPGEGPFSVTETEFSDAPLDPTELANLSSQCLNIFRLGSGSGKCTCGTDK
jgi:hypothetical protein